MNSKKNRFLVFCRLPYAQKINTISIAYLVLKMYFFVTYVPLKRYYHRFTFGTYKEGHDLQPYLKEIRQIVKICALMPFRVSCLVECLVVQNYLRRYHITAPICLGIMKEESISAHAWVLPAMSNGYKSLFK